MPSTPSDQAKDQDRHWSQLMAATQAGDRHAYARLLREIAPMVRALARRRLAEPDAVEDVVQDTLLTLHRVRHTYEPGRPFTPWLAAIAQRRALDALRRRGRVNAREVHDAAGYETFPDPRANKEAEDGLALQSAAGLIETLPPQQRQALELVKVHEMTLIEAAAASGQSVASLKVNVHRAIKRLRKLAGRDE